MKRELITLMFMLSAASLWGDEASEKTFPVTHGGKSYTVALRGPDYTRGTFTMPETGVGIPVWKYQTQPDCGPHCLGKFVNARDWRSSAETIGLSFVVYEKDAAGEARAEVEKFEALTKMSSFTVPVRDGKHTCPFNAWDAIIRDIGGVSHAFHISSWCRGNEVFLIRRDPKTKRETGQSFYTYSGPLYNNSGHKMDAVRIGNTPKDTEATLVIEIIWDSDLRKYQIDFIEKNARLE